MRSPIIIKQNQEFALAVLGKLVGGSLDDYFESGSTIGAVILECENNERIQQLALNCIWGAFDKAKSNREKLEAELRAVFDLEEVGA
jgi:hypothetical protein